MDVDDLLLYLNKAIDPTPIIDRPPMPTLRERSRGGQTEGNRCWQQCPEIESENQVQSPVHT